MNLQEIREQINKLATDMQGIVGKARDEKRELSVEENQTFDKIDADREALLATERRLRKVEELDGSERRTEHSAPSYSGNKESRNQPITSADRAEALRSWLQAPSEIRLTPKQMEICQRVGVNPHSKQFTLRMASSAPKSLRENDFNAWERRALSTLVSTSPEDGSYLIPDNAMGPLERALLEFGGMRQAARIDRTTTGAAYPIPTNDDTSNKGALLAENTIAVEKDPAFGQLVLNAFKFTSKKVLVSLELIQDSQDNLAATLGSMLGERIGRITNDYFTTGTGSSEPKGVVPAATSSGTTLAAKTPTYAEMVATEHGVDPAYRTGSRWMFHDTMFAEIKKIVDASTGRPIWLPSMIGGAPDTILGYPYTINQSMAVAASTGSGKALLFGNFSKFIIRDVRDITLFRLDELYAEYYQVAFVAFSRHDSDLLDAGTHPIVYTANHS